MNVNLGHQNVLGEAARVIVCRVKGVAGSVVAPLAVTTGKAGNMVTDKDSVAHLIIFDFAADLAKNACGFMPQDTRGFGYSVPFDNVASADAARHNFKHNFLFARTWRWKLFYAHVVIVVVESS